MRTRRHFAVPATAWRAYLMRFNVGVTTNLPLGTDINTAPVLGVASLRHALRYCPPRAEESCGCSGSRLHAGSRPTERRSSPADSRAVDVDQLGDPRSGRGVVRSVNLVPKKLAADPHLVRRRARIETAGFVLSPTALVSWFLVSIESSASCSPRWRGRACASCNPRMPRKCSSGLA